MNVMPRRCLLAHVDDLAEFVGTELGPGDWLTVSQDRIDTFADATDDHQWIHVDPEEAREGPFGTTIAHGLLTLSLFIPLFSDMLEVTGVTTKVNYGLNKVRFPAPVPSGARIRLGARLLEVQEVGGNGVQVTLDGTIEIENSAKPACVLQSVLRFYR
jgi:acyl dehydratase